MASCAIFRTGLRAPHMFRAGDLVPAGTVLVTPDIDVLIICIDMLNIKYLDLKIYSIYIYIGLYIFI